MVTRTLSVDDCACGLDLLRRDDRVCQDLMQGVDGEWQVFIENIDLVDRLSGAGESIPVSNRDPR